MHIHTYLVLDGARLREQLNEAKQLNNNYRCLYKGKVEEYLQDVAPYLFTCSAATEMAQWFIKEGFGKAWGVGICTDQDFETVYKHLRRFLMIKTENGKQLYFRYYDPRVLSIFLPTCDRAQVIDFFGPVRSFIVEHNTTNEAIEFSHENGVLQQRLISVEEVWEKIGKYSVEELMTTVDKKQAVI